MFELRRIFRQRQRNRVPIGNKKIDLFVMARQRVLYKFSLFFGGWCLLGHALFSKFFFEVGEDGERRFIPPDVVKKRVRILREDNLNRLMPSFKPPATSHPFDA